MGKLPFFYMKPQYQAFMASINNPEHARIFEILFGSGCRIAEIIGQEKKRCITCSSFYRKRLEGQDRRAPRIPWCKTHDMKLPKPPTKHLCPQFTARFPGLHVEQVDLENGTIRVMGKGSKERIVILSSKAQQALREVIGDRKSGRIDFGIGIRRMEQLARFYAKKAGLPEVGKYARWSPHRMRDTNLTFMVEGARELGEKDALSLAQQQAGHEHIEQTMKYLHLGELEAKTKKRALDKGFS
jgi:hypothetical protein